MKATGIVVEYNPFHNGHKYHALKARETTEADVIIAVMSGNFLQRGEPAFINKWMRTKMALANGVDIVFELPYAFATAHAPLFAKGAIEILDAAQCHAFCFGSEDGELAPFENSLTLLSQTGAEYEQTVKDAVNRGFSYPRALNEAYLSAVQSSNIGHQSVDLTKPNNILGFHYMQAAKNIESTMKAATIPRFEANYYDDVVEGNQIASATGIRKSFFQSASLEKIANFMPKTSYESLVNWQDENTKFGSWESFYPLLRFTILREGPKSIAKIADVTEGIENLFYRAAANNGTFQGFMTDVKSKRYTWTRIQRMLTHIFTGFTYDIRGEIERPTYLRLLGMSATGRLYLNKNKKRLKLPIISKAAAFTNPSLQMDIHAADLYAIGTNDENAKIGTDYVTSPLILT